MIAGFKVVSRAFSAVGFSTRGTLSGVGELNSSNRAGSRNTLIVVEDESSSAFSTGLSASAFVAFLCVARSAGSKTSGEGTSRALRKTVSLP